MAAVALWACGDGSNARNTNKTVGGGARAIFVYTVNFETQDVSGYRLGTDGALAGVTGSPFAAGAGPRGIAATSSGQVLYVSNTGDNSILSYTVNASSGSLTRTTEPPRVTGLGPEGLARTASFLYSANVGSGDVSAFSIDSNTGALTGIGGSPFPAGSEPFFAVSDPQSRFLYVLNRSSSTVGQGTITAYSITAVSGNLTQTPGGPVQLPATPRAAAVDRTGAFLFVTMNGSLGGPPGEFLGVFAIQPSGDLAPISGSPFAMPGRPGAVVAHPSASFLYVAEEMNSTVMAFAIGSNGALTAVTGSPFALSQAPMSLALSPTGEHLVAGHGAQLGVSVFTVNATTGALSLVSGSPFANPGNHAGNVLVLERTP